MMMVAMAVFAYALPDGAGVRDSVFLHSTQQVCCVCKGGTDPRRFSVCILCHFLCHVVVPHARSKRGVEEGAAAAAAAAAFV